MDSCWQHLFICHHFVKNVRYFSCKISEAKFYWIGSIQIKIFESIFELNFLWKKDYWIFFLTESSWKKLYWIIFWIEFYREMNEWIIFWIDICNFWQNTPLLVILDTFWAIFGHFSYSTSINDALTIELNYLLNWISRVYFELNNILKWIFGKTILNRILNESLFGKIQTLNWIRFGITHH